MGKFYRTLSSKWEDKMMHDAEQFKVSLIGKNGKAVATSSIGILPAMKEAQLEFEGGNLDESEKFIPMSEEDAEELFNEFNGKPSRR